MKKWMSLSLLALLVSGAMMTAVTPSADAADWRNNNNGRIERLRAEAFRKRQIAANNSYWRNHRYDNRAGWNNNRAGWNNGWFNNNNRWDHRRWDNNHHRWINAPGRW